MRKIQRFAAVATITAARPSWLGRRAGGGALYLTVGDVAVVLAPDAAAPGQLVAVTCLVARGATRRRRG